MLKIFKRAELQSGGKVHLKIEEIAISLMITQCETFFLGENMIFSKNKMVYLNHQAIFFFDKVHFRILGIKFLR